MDDDLHFGEPVRIPIEDSIDLHTFSPRDIPSLLEEYLNECLRHGIFQVRIIHGKGTGAQRKIVESFLTKNPLIHSFFQAPPEAGGWGATIAVLKGKNKAR
ncbi:MAG: Smr/MutS family protein [Pseudomonadota bacterium]